MLLKIIIGTLFTVGLVSQLTTADIEIKDGLKQEIRDFSDYIPGFNFFKGFFQRFQMTAQNGSLQGYNTIKNITAWRPSFNGTASSISQMVQMPNMTVVYDQTTTQLGILKSVGKLPVDLTTSTVQMIITATPGTNGTCNLTLEAILAKLNLKPDVASLGLVGILLQTVLGALTGIITVLTGVLSSVLPSVLTLLLGEQVAKAVDLDELCKLILAGNATNFPQPNINM